MLTFRPASCGKETQREICRLMRKSTQIYLRGQFQEALKFKPDKMLYRKLLGVISANVVMSNVKIRLKLPHIRTKKKQSVRDAENSVSS